MQARMRRAVVLVALLGVGALQIAMADTGAARCKVRVKANQQCGGKRAGPCKGAACAPAPWPTHCCAAGLECVPKGAGLVYVCAARKAAGAVGANSTKPLGSAGKPAAAAPVSKQRPAAAKPTTATGAVEKPAPGAPIAPATPKAPAAKPVTSLPKPVPAAPKPAPAAPNPAPAVHKPPVAAAPKAPAPVAAAPNASSSAADASADAKRREDEPLVYAGALAQSLLFFEAQRSGKLPAANRIKWRGDSGLLERTADGRDVSGGWYTTGEPVKSNLPNAWAASVLAWSLHEFKEGYLRAGQYQAALDSVKWAADYFLQCVGDGSAVVAQVGSFSGAPDQCPNGRPEDKAAPGPIFTLTDDRPGADAVAAMGAALGAASVLFAEADERYSLRLLGGAYAAYDAAARNQATYNAAVPNAAGAGGYRSATFLDDMAWCAAWLFVRTGDLKYRWSVKELYDKFVFTEGAGRAAPVDYSYDYTMWGPIVLLSRWFPEDPDFKARLDRLTREWVAAPSAAATGSAAAAAARVKRTRKGLAFAGAPASAPRAANAAFLLLAYANGARDADLKRRVECFAHDQLDYLLGRSTGRSLVVGVGPNPPKFAAHCAAACAAPAGERCGRDAYARAREAPNPHTLTGALVAGPESADDAFHDERGAAGNGVAVDHNAGLTGALAALSMAHATPRRACGGGSGAVGAGRR